MPRKLKIKKRAWLGTFILISSTALSASCFYSKTKVNVEKDNKSTNESSIGKQPIKEEPDKKETDKQLEESSLSDKSIAEEMPNIDPTENNSDPEALENEKAKNKIVEAEKNDQINTQTTKEKLKAFSDEIVESAKNEYPSVFIGRNASQYLISSSNAMLAQLQLSKNDNQPYNDVIYIIDTVVNDYEKTLNNEKQRFNYDELLKTYGDTALLNENNELTNVEDGRLRVVDKQMYLDKTKRGSNYSVYPRSIDELKTYLKGYIDNVELFDFYIPDISFTDIDYQLRNWIITHANKIIILSDGNAQPYKFINGDYIPWAKRQTNHYSKEELTKFWNKGLESKKLDINFRHFYTLEEKFKIFNLIGDYSQYFNKELDLNDTGWAKLDIKTYPLNFKDFAASISELDSNKYYEEFSTLFHLKDKTILDFITYGKDNYDPNKENLIFIGSSLFRRDAYSKWRLRLEFSNVATDEVHNYTERIRELYPPEKYNYFYKLHPVYKNEDAVKYVELLNNSKQNKSIILDPSISWENMLAIDLNNIASNKSIFFKSSEFNKNTVKSKLYGLQATTTVLLTAIAMLQEYFNIDMEQTLDFVDLNNFPIPESFHLIYRDRFYQDKQKGYETNYEEMLKIYKYFVFSHNFPSIKSIPSMSKFLQREVNKDEMKMDSEIEMPK
ncbi:hypothetical protein [Mycoplasma bradburyae]|uniref:hypothetical protein n=1 Tax=Mycoplasma bradburyae TaxID=2963128 RepID=UPI00233F8488|nr:hypothetical protein [Mycoplasma bradburyae]MDC4182991.1 hypothetical protein [Mycoplasma bradburyae]